MKKYLSLLKYELKTLFKDSTNIFMLSYPVIMILMLGVILPILLNKTDDAPIEAILIILIVALAVGSFVSGAMLGFSLIENKDEKTILNIGVTPIKVEGYAIFKSTYAYFISIISNLIIVGGLKIINNDVYIVHIGNESIHLLDNLSWLHIIVFAMVSGLFVPFVALTLGTIAKNKIEGFAYVKSGGFIVMLPVLMILNFFSDIKQYILGVIPSFWPIKAMLNVATSNSNPSNLNYFIYMLIGAIYMIFLTSLMLKVFIKKTT